MAKQARPVMLQALALILLNWLITPLIVLGQPQLRVVHLRSYSDQPVELELKIADEVIIADKSFVAIDDWLKDLSWRMKNASDKSIVCIEVELDFHGLGSSKAERVYTFRYGQKPDAQDAVGEPKLLKPSETANFKLSDTEYNEIKQFVEQKQQSEAVSTVMSVVETKIATVFFADRSIWKDGKMLRLSPSNQ
jgi:hypothetical protein